MYAGIIWYRARPSDAASKKIEYMLAGIDCSPRSEEATIRPDNIPTLLSDSLSRNTVTVIVGGMDILRERDNIIYILSSCLSLPLEEGRRSRSHYIYDTLRSVLLPTFEQAVLFPGNQPNTPEGVLITASGQAIIILPGDDNSLEHLCTQIGDYLLGVRTTSEKKQEEQEIRESPLPDYVERARRKRMAQLERERQAAEQRKSTSDSKYELSAQDIRLAMMHTTLAPEDALLETNVAPPKKKRSAAAQKKNDSAAQRKAEAREAKLRAEAEAQAAKLRAEAEAKAMRKAQEEQRNLRFQPRTQSAIELKRERAEARMKAAAPARTQAAPEVVATTPAAAQKQKPTVSYTARMRAGAIVLVFAIITGLCVVAFGFYESGIIETHAQYLSELRAMYTDSVSDAEIELLPEGASKNFARLYSANSQIGGYLEIDGTGISLPVMTSDYSNPNYYDSHDFYGQDDPRGCLRFDEDNVISAGIADPNTVIYGNNPSDGSVFSVLEKYLNRAFFIEHPVISMDTLYEQSDWLIFSVCVVSGDTVGAFNFTDTSFTGAYTNEVFLYNLFIRSLFYTPVEVFPGDRLLTLVTDSDEFTGAKLIVCARQMREDDSLEAFATGVIENELVLMPDFWYELHGEQKPVVPKLELPTLFDISTQPADYFKTSTTTTTTTTTTAATSTTTATTAAATASDSTQPTSSDNADATTTAPTTGTTLPPSTTVDNMRISSNGKIIDDTAVNVLAMIIEAEMGSGFSMEALKAQAVAAYTYYLYSGGRAKAPSFPTKTASSKCTEAAASVVGQYITVNGHVPYTPYYATSAGKTANNADINGTALGYLVAVDCSVDANASDYMTVKEVAASTVASKVKSAKGINLYSIEDKTQWLRVLERDANGLSVKSVQVGDKTYRGNTLHLSILGYSCLRSPCFWIEYNATNDTFIFTSYGYGTGVGMSQNGANFYAQQGWNYLQILQHFYTGISISS